MIKRLHHAQITVSAKDEVKAREFYLKTLGLKEIPKPDALLKNGGFWIRLGDVQIHVGLEEGAEPTKTRAHLAYEVEDLDFWKSCLGSLGPVDGGGIPHCRRFEFRDPFGNRVEFIQCDDSFPVAEDL